MNKCFKITKGPFWGKKGSSSKPCSDQVFLVLNKVSLLDFFQKKRTPLVLVGGKDGQA